RSVEHEKLHLMIDDFMPFATLVEAEELSEETAETHELVLYQVPNFTTKINLLNLLMRDDEVFDKAVVFVNTRLTAQKLSQSLHAKKGEVAVLRPMFHDDAGFDEINDFKKTPECRILLIANENTKDVDLSGIPFVFHFEIPENNDVFVQHILKTSDDE